MSEREPSQTQSAGRPSLCRNCKSLIGPGQTVCAVCGADNTSQPVGQQPSGRRFFHHRDAMSFAEAVLTRPARFTILLLVANIFVYLLTVLSAGSLGDSALFEAALIAYGGKTNALINMGQWWRFVTPVFLHGNVIHLLMNMYGLMILGPYVEKLYGSARFVFFWVLTGAAGVLGSYLTVRPGMHVNAFSRFLFKNADVVSVGASGALFGLIGVLFVFGIKFRHELPDGFKRAFGTGMLPTILLNVFIGFTIPVIDNAAHMGGFVAGAVLALFVGYERPGERARVAVFWHILQAAALALVALSFTMVALHFQGRRPALSNITSRNLLNSGRSDAQDFLNAVNRGQSALVAAINGNPEQKEMESAIESLDNAPKLDDKAGALVTDLKGLLVRAREASQQGQAKGRAARRATEERQRALIKDYEAWAERLSQWVKTDGKNHGIYIEDPKPSPSTSNGPEPQAQNGSEKR